VAYQLIGKGKAGDVAIAFAADVPAFGARVYRFADAPARAKTDLKIEETATTIRLTTGRVGIAIRKTLADGAGPIEAVRLTGGKWIGGSSLTGDRPVSYSAKLVDGGPVFAEVLCRAEFSKGRTWEMRLRLPAGEPVVLVDERFTLGNAAAMVLSLGRNFAPSSLLYRTGKGRVGQCRTWKIAPGEREPVFVMEPWVHWWERLRQGTWFGLYNDKDADLLSVATREADVWVQPAARRSAAPKGLPTSPIRLKVQAGGGDVTMAFPLAGGRRKWMIGSHDKKAGLAVLDGKNRFRAPLPQQYQIKHGIFPLDRVKDYVYDWPGDHENYPRLFVTKKDLPKLRRRTKINPKLLKQYAVGPLRQHTLEGPVAYALATGDSALTKLFRETGVDWMQREVNSFLKQDYIATLGFAPHHQASILVAMNVADVVLASETLSPELRRRLLAQIAFLGYTVNREDFWSPRRGYSANPNMTTTVAAFQTIIACMVPKHPEAKAWFARGAKELKERQLDGWSDANGGWLEAPHYAMVSYDYILGCAVAARNAGLADFLFAPKMRKVIEWFAKTSTPPDSRIGGARHHPCIGNTYICEPTGEFGIVAYLWKDKDPAFSAQMQWMHTQHNSYGQPGVGGFFPTFAGFRTVLSDASLPAKAPTYKSELFPKTSVALRNAYPSDRETMLLMIAGRHHAHYDRDSGSITLWGKGRICADDFGYYGNVPGEDHNMLMSPAAPDRAIMHIREFAPSDRFDYVRGRKRAWTRQIAFVKDADPLGPNYFVLCDSLTPAADATWRLWMTAKKVTTGPNTAAMIGKEDVDMDIFFAAPQKLPQKLPLTTKTISRRSGSGMRPNWGWGPMTTTQTGVIATLAGSDAITAVLYPRLKTEKPAVFTALAGGKGVKVETAAGTDYVFLHPKRFRFRDGGITFEGTAGMVQKRGGRVVLALGAAGRIAAEGRELRSDKPASKAWPAK